MWLSRSPDPPSSGQDLSPTPEPSCRAASARAPSARQRYPEQEAGHRARGPYPGRARVPSRRAPGGAPQGDKPSGALGALQGWP